MPYAGARGGCDNGSENDNNDNNDSMGIAMVVIMTMGGGKGKVNGVSMVSPDRDVRQRQYGGLVGNENDVHS